MIRGIRTIAIVGVAAFLLGVMSLHLIWPLESGQYDSEGTRVWLTGLAAYPLAAAFVLTHRPGNRIGWALAVTAFSAGLLGFSGWYGVTFEGKWASDYVEASSRIASTGQFIGIIALLYLFPTGAAVSRRFAAAFKVFLAGMLSLTLVELLSPRPLEATERENPLGVLPEWSITVIDLAALFVLGCIVLSIASLVVRWRRAQLVERAQLKWFLAATALTVVALAAAVITWNTGQTQFIGAIDPVFALMILAFWSIPAAVVIAVLRYRLFEIDLLINRSLVYTVLTVGTVATYLFLVVAGSGLARLLSRQESNEVVVAATTLIVAALFQPARRRIQSLVDRRFYRSKYDAARTVEAFQSRLRDQTDIEALRNDLGATVHAALQPTSVAVWIRSGGRE